MAVVTKLPLPSRLFTRVSLALLVVSIVFYGTGVTYAPVRLLYVLAFGCGLVWSGILFHKAGRRLPIVWTLPALLMIGLLLFGMLGNRPPDVGRLRQAYRAQLLSFQGTHYIWGGESHFGIDCSGLARIALCEAMVIEGVRQGNSRLLGPMLWSFWWQDLSAQAMGNGASGYTRSIGSATELATADTSELHLGDLAVTSDGSHVMIYVGNRRWVEANPDDRGVVINAATKDSLRGYFGTPVKLMRWWVLD